MHLCPITDDVTFGPWLCVRTWTESTPRPRDSRRPPAGTGNCNTVGFGARIQALLKVPASALCLQPGGDVLRVKGLAYKDEKV